MNNWRNTTLGEMLTFQRGFDITKNQQQAGSYFVISSSGPQSTHNEFMVEGPGVVIGRKGTLGSVFYSEEPFWPHDTTLWIKDFHGNDPKFAYYFLKTLHLEQYDAGASNPSLNRNHIHLLPIKYPPLPSQRRIADILSAYDDLIENNARRIRILERMAQSIYHEWFRKIDKEFLPKEWELDTLGNHITVDRGVSHKGEFMNGDGLPLLNLKSFLSNGGYRVDGLKSYSGDYKAKQVVHAGDIVLANTDLTQAGSIVGNPAIVPNIKGEILYTHHLYAIRFRPDTYLLKYYLYHLLSDDSYKSFAKGRAIGTTVLGLAQDGVLDFEFPRPPKELVKKFDEVVSPIYELKDALEAKNANLRQTRDLLLPRLVSGEIEV